MFGSLAQGGSYIGTCSRLELYSGEGELPYRKGQTSYRGRPHNKLGQNRARAPRIEHNND